MSSEKPRPSATDSKESRERAPEKSDPDVRMAIMRKFYDAYRQHGLSVLVMASAVAAELKLDAAQGRRCFDYLKAKGWIRPMTLAGGYSPTVSLVDEIERQGVSS